MPTTDAARYSLPALQSLDLPQPIPGQAGASPVNGQPPRPPTSGQSFQSTHQINNGPPPLYRNGADFNRLPSLAGVAASLPHSQPSAPQEAPRESAYQSQSTYESRILPPPVPRSQGPPGSYGQQGSAPTLPPLSASTGPRDLPKTEEPNRQNPFPPPPIPLRSQQQQYGSSAPALNGDAYPSQMTPSYSSTTLVHDRTPSQASTFTSSQRQMPAPSPDGPSFYSPITAIPVQKTEGWAGEDQYTYLSGTVNGVDQDPSEMDPNSIMQVVVSHCNAIVQFTAQYGATPRGTLQTPSPSPNAAFPQGIPEDKLSDMVNRAIAVVRLLRALSHRQAQAKPGEKGLLDGLDGESNPTADGDTDSASMRPGKRLKTSPGKDATDVEAPKPKYKKRSRAPPPSQCASCGISETPEWRKGPDGARTLCNACGLHFAKLSRNRERDVDASGRPTRPPVNIEMLRNSIRATCQPARTGSNGQPEPPSASASSSMLKQPRVVERHVPHSNSSMPMVWEAPVAARPANPYAASAVEQANMAQMQASSYSSTAQQSPADSLQSSSGYGAPVAQSPVSTLHTPTYPTPTSHLPSSAYPPPMSQSSDPLYQLAQAAGSAWNSQTSQSVLSQTPVSQAPPPASTTSEHQYWSQQPQSSLLANQMSNVRTDLPEPPMNTWSSMRMQQTAPLGYGQPPTGSTGQLQENARVY